MQHVISSHNFKAGKHNDLVTSHTERTNLLTRFLTWCDTQEEKRFLWLAIALLGDIGMILPLTLLAVLLGSGNNFTLWILVFTANVPVFALNLAALPTKFTVPALFFAWIMNLVIILSSIALFFVV